MAKLPDLLAELPQSRRWQREHEDAEFIKENATVLVSQIAKEKNLNVAGVLFKAKEMGAKQIKDEVPDFVICARIDLDHPLYYPDNCFAECTDCGCSLQHRPSVPQGIKLCITCGARRIRTELQE